MPPRPKSLYQVVEFMAHGQRYGNAISEFVDEVNRMVAEGAMDELEFALAQEPDLLEENHPQYEYWINAYLGGAAEYLATKYSVKVPEWVNAECRFLKGETFFDNGGLKSLNPILMEESPPAFRKRGIYTEDRPLRRA